MTLLHFKVLLAAIFIKININNRKIRPYSQFYSLITSKCVPLRMLQKNNWLGSPGIDIHYKQN